MRFFAAIDIGGSSIKGMLANWEMQQICTHRRPTYMQEGVQGIMAGVIELIEHMIAKAGLDITDLGGIGVSSFGFIDAKRGVGIKSLRLDIKGYPYVAILTARFGVPVVIDNDARMAVLGELRFGRAAGYSNVVQFTLGTALATGMIIDGRLVRGRDNVAGEVSHFVIETTNGLICSCGRGGCARAYVSAVAMRGHALELMARDHASSLWQACNGDAATFDLTMLSSAIAADDQVATTVRNRLVLYLSSLCTSIIIMLNPEIVLIGGGISNLDDHLMVPLRKTVQDVIFDPVHDCPIERASLGAQAGVYGALAAIAKEVGAARWEPA